MNKTPKNLCVTNFPHSAGEPEEPPTWLVPPAPAVHAEKNTRTVAHRRCLLPTLLAFCAIAPTANADILYSHTFDGNGDALELTAPDIAKTGIILGVDHGTSAANWTNRPDGVKQDGTFGGNGVHATLPFTPVSGFIYTLEIVGTVSGSGTNWLGAGFLNQSNASSGNIFFSPILFGYTRPGSTDAIKQLASFDNYGRINSSGSNRVGTSGNTASPSTLTMVLDTTDGNDSWDAQWFVNGNLFATKTNMGTFAESKILGVGVAGYPEAQVSSFSLTVELPDMVLNDVSPQGAGIYPGSNLVATFTEDIALTGSGSVTITDATDGSDTRVIHLPDPQVTTSGKNLIISPATHLDFATDYHISISPGAVERAAFSAPPFPGTTPGQWTFATAVQDFTAPVIISKFPADDALEAPYNGKIVATFDGALLRGSGAITLINLTDSSDTRTISVTDSSQVTVSGNALTIDPIHPLNPETDYAVQITSGAVFNFSDLPFAGIAESDTTTWNFRTSVPRIVDILVAYTPAALAHHGTENGMLAHIQACIADTNESFRNSRIIGEVRLAGTHLVSYTESSTNYTDDLTRLTNIGNGFMDDLHPLRDALGADLVCLLRSGTVGTVGGLAWRLLDPVAGEPSRGFSVVTTQVALGGQTFAHEIGHNLGMAHAKNDPGNIGIFPDSNGHRFTGTSGQQFRTIMSYAPGTRTPYFSNPDVTYDGTPTGVGPPAAPNSANAARTISLTIPTVSEYRTLTTTVTYTANGADSGTVPIDPNSPYPGGATVIVLGPGNLARSGFSFTDWNTAPDGSGTAYAENDSFTINGPVTLHAQWAGQSHTLTVNAGLDQTASLIGASSWTPAEIATVAWYDASDANTITQSHGAVSQWNDKSGNGNHATQGTESNRPTYNPVDARLNHLPTIGYDQGFKFLSTPSLAAVRNVYLVTYYDDPDDRFDNHRVLFSDTGNSLKLQGVNGGSAWVSAAGFDKHRNGSASSSNANALPMGPTLWTARGTASHNNKVWRILGGANNWQYWEYGAIGEIIFTDGSEDPETQQHIEGHLAHKWGLTANLPANHPHKTTPPSAAGATVNLNGTVSGVEGGSFTTTWSLVSGPAEVQFGNAAALDTTATFTAKGTYILRLSANYGNGTITDDLVVSIGDLPFLTWAASEGGGVTFKGDANGDGIADGMAWLLGAETPSQPAHDLLPKPSADPGGLVLHFKMRNTATRGPVDMVLQFTADLGVNDPWENHSIMVPEASGTVDGVEFIITQDENTGLNEVRATMPASTTSLFARLKGEPHAP